jgi:hypothetical protein
MSENSSQPPTDEQQAEHPPGERVPEQSPEAAPPSSQMAEQFDRLQQTMADGFQSLQAGLQAFVTTVADAAGKSARQQPPQPAQPNPATPVAAPQAPAEQNPMEPPAAPQPVQAQPTAAQAVQAQPTPSGFPAPETLAPPQAAYSQAPQIGQPQPTPPPEGVQPMQAQPAQPQQPPAASGFPQIQEQPSQKASAGGRGGSALQGVGNWVKEKLTPHQAGHGGGQRAGQSGGQAGGQQAGPDDRWKQIVFAGADFANNQGLLQLREAVVRGMMSGDANSMNLVGQILIFQATSGDRLPLLLKDLGESYYRFNPGTQNGDDPMRESLVSWIHRKCEGSGVANTITLVRPGDRYDSARHHSKQRGVEVARVYGWVVLRDNGKVYTKATVDVR